MDVFSHRDFSSNDFPPVKDWLAIFVIPRHEKRVESHFRVRGIEGFLPLFQKQASWKDGSKHTLQLPLFPNYIFARVGYSERASVLDVPGVRFIAGGLRHSLPVPDAYIHFLKETTRLGRIEPHPYLTAGTRVRIRYGVMAGTEGVLLRKKNSFRVVLTLEMIMRSVTIEVAIEDIEPVGPHPILIHPKPPSSDVKRAGFCHVTN